MHTTGKLFAFRRDSGREKSRMRSFLLTERDRKVSEDRPLTMLPGPAWFACAGDRLP
jgi:hypothetical protein